MSTCVMEFETTCKRGPGQNPSSRETPPPSPVFPRISAPNGNFSRPVSRQWEDGAAALQPANSRLSRQFCRVAPSASQRIFLLMFVMNKIPGLSVKKSHHLLNFRECEEAPGVVQNPGRPAKRRPASCPRNQPASLLTELSSQSPSTLRSEIKLFSLQPRSHNSPQVLIKARLSLKPGQDPAPTSPVFQSKAR